MKYFDAFAGVGGFSIGIEKAYETNNNFGGVTSTPDTKNRWNKSVSELSNGVGRRTDATCVGYSEIDKYAIQVYQYHYPERTNYGDITKINWQDVPDFDLLVGGSPCQDLSVAGKQKGLSGERSGLFFEFVRCLKEKQPRNFIWENVKGALSSSRGWDFGRVQIEFSEAGYDVEWQVLNAKDFGVPQNRERVFVVGHLRGRSRPKVFPITTNNGKAPQELSTKSGQTDRFYSTDGLSPTVPTSGGGGHEPKIGVAVDRGQIKPRTTSNAIDANYWKGIDNHQARTGVAMRWSRNELGKEARRKAKSELGKDYTPFNKGHRNLIPARENISGAVTGALNKDALLGIGEELKIRRLTPLEAERLMGWPDRWTKEPNISDTQRYKMCGNGVVSNVVEEIIKRMIL
jgi:DNA (cytosine-5)-methyltransferase 1